MSFPADGIEGTYKNNIDDVRMYLDSKHPDSYVVINISQRSYRTNKLNDRVRLSDFFQYFSFFLIVLRYVYKYSYTK